MLHSTIPTPATEPLIPRMPAFRIGETRCRNAPTEHGAKLGRNLARMVDEAEPLYQHRNPGAAERCHDCAFRAGSYPNQCGDTAFTAGACALSGETFWCHHGQAEGEPTRECAGWRILVSVAGTGETPARAGQLSMFGDEPRERIFR